MTNLKILEFSRGHSYKMWTEQRIGPITILGCTTYPAYPVSVSVSEPSPATRKSGTQVGLLQSFNRSSAQERTSIHEGCNVMRKVI